MHWTEKPKIAFVIFLILKSSVSLAAGCNSCSSQELRDARGKLLGKVSVSQGKTEGRDASGKFKGTYDCDSNETRKADGQLFGSGNLLAHLILGED